MSTSAQAGSLSDADLPALYRSADRCSTTAQKTYLGLVIADLAALVLGGMVTAFSFEDQAIVTSVAIIGGLALLVSCILTWVILLQPFEKTWFAGRAVAESVKTLAWKYAVKALPFDEETSIADGKLVESLRKILAERPHLGADLGTLDSTGEQITDTMRQLRALPLEDRRAIYLNDIIENQRKWYAAKAAGNRKAKLRWFAAVIVSQVVAAGVAFASVAWPVLLGLPAVVVSIASALLAWLQVKQHQELAQAYGIAAHELGLIAVRSNAIASDQDLSDFVQDAENAVSREHTLWIARRDHTN